MTHRLRRLQLVAVLAALAALFVPASALARTTKVVPFKTVAGIPLQQTPQQVVKELGKPSHTIRVSGKIAEYDYRKLALTVEFDTLHHPLASDFVGVAVGFATPDIHYRTVHGLHIGSTKAQVRKAFGKSCHWSLGQCTVYKGTPGSVGSYSFGLVFEQGKLSSMVNQYVFNDE
jgi:hypothetical protein